MGKMKHYVDVRRVLMAALAPLVVAGLFVIAVKATALFRYDRAYFKELYIERYESPGAVARALEAALQENDRRLLAELQGLRRPAAFAASPKIILTMLWEQGDRYFTYMYLDMKTLERHPHYIEEVIGRWVVAPADAHYYLHSGAWLKVFLPVAIVWWLVEAVVVLALWVFRVSARLRAHMYGDEELRTPGSD